MLHNMAINKMISFRANEETVNQIEGLMGIQDEIAHFHPSRGKGEDSINPKSRNHDYSRGDIIRIAIDNLYRSVVKEALKVKPTAIDN